MSEKEKVRQYYQRIYLTAPNQYRIKHKDGRYLGLAKTIEEALYYRDKYSTNPQPKLPRPYEVDLKTDNPYYRRGLKYPLPDRLNPEVDYKPSYNKGSIHQRSKSSYVLQYSKKYLCSCRTYEQAYYVLRELAKYDFDKSRIPEIMDSYPEWYSWLVQFYRYITVDYYYKKRTGKNKYLISIPRRYLRPGQNLELIRGYTKLEDALFERDFLEEHEWDYNLLVEAINDLENPYYEMELPPYPERKIRNVSKRKPHDKELKEMQQIILAEPSISQRELAKRIGTNDMNIRNWLHNYNTDWLEFRTIVLSGDDPLEKLTLKPIIYTPDLSPSTPGNFKNYIHRNSASKKYPYNIEYKRRGYGVYPTRELALKVVKDLIACDWDYNQLKDIQRRHGYVATHGKRNLIYKVGNTYQVRKSLPDGQLGYFGCYPCRRIAEIVRGLLKEANWNKEELPEIKESANRIYNLEKQYQHNMFGGVRL